MTRQYEKFNHYGDWQNSLEFYTFFGCKLYGVIRNQSFEIHETRNEFK